MTARVPVWAAVGVACVLGSGAVAAVAHVALAAIGGGA
jgi:hypothetical protein